MTVSATWRVVPGAAVGPVTLVAAITIACVCLAPPAPRSVSAPAGEFSAARAFQHVAAIAAAPRPIGSLHHDAAQRYILDALHAAGVTGHIERTIARRGPVLARIANILATLPGDPAWRGDHRGTIAVMAHYDSVASGPGAADDAAAVAAMLETARALGNGPRLRNDIAFVFTDAEEQGVPGASLLDASAFDVVVNFEARGTSGASLMFETGVSNARAVRHFAGLSHPHGSSLYVEAYRRLPNDTDFTWFRNRTDGLNFAFIDDYLDYHSELDDVAHLSLASLQHHGDNMLEIVRSLGDADLTSPPAGDEVFFDVLGRWVIHYPVPWALPLAIVLALAIAVGTSLAVRFRTLTISGLVAGLVIAVLAPAAAAGAAWAAWAALRVGSSAHRLPQGHAYDDGLALLAIIALVAVAVAALSIAIRRGSDRIDRLCGAVLAWAVLGIVAALLAPGVSYLVVLPGLLASGAGAVALARRDRRWAWAAPIVIAPSALLFVPVVVALDTALTLNAAPITAAVAGLHLGLVLPLVLPRRRAGLVLGGLGCGFGVLVMASVATARIDADHRRGDSLAYLFDADSGRAMFATSDASLDAWTRQALGSDARSAPLDGWLLDSQNEFLTAPAAGPAAELVPPRVELARAHDGTQVAEIAMSGEVGRLDVSIAGTRSVGELSVDGVQLGSTTHFRYWAPGPSVAIRFKTEHDEPARVEARVLRYGLPPGVISPRPDYLMQMPSVWGWPDITVIRVSSH